MGYQNDDLLKEINILRKSPFGTFFMPSIVSRSANRICFLYICSPDFWERINSGCIRFRSLTAIMELSKNYIPSATEEKWYRHWTDKKYFNSTPDERPAFTVVIPPPNVTGVLHMGTKRCMIFW